MRLSRGPKENTLTLEFSDFSGGINLSAAETKFPDVGSVGATLWVKNFEVMPGGDLQKRADGNRYTLRDPDTGLAITEETRWYVQYPRVNGELMILIGTPNRLLQFNPWREENLTVLHRWNRYVTTMDWEVSNDRLYITTGVNYMLCWDGSNAPTYISEGYPANYRYPSVVRRHMGRLALTGFTDLQDSRAQSNLKVTGSPMDLADATVLNEAMIELRTADDDVPVGMGSLQSGLVADQPSGRSVAALIVGKGRDSIAVYGSDFANFSDVEVHTHTAGVGWVGPRAWCHGERGLYFASPFGIYLVNGPRPAECVSKGIAPVWGRDQALSDAPFPHAVADRLSRTVLFSDPEHQRIFCLMPVQGGT
jgi:hypothetical protein